MFEKMNVGPVYDKSAGAGWGDAEVVGSIVEYEIAGQRCSATFAGPRHFERAKAYVNMLQSLMVVVFVPDKEEAAEL